MEYVLPIAGDDRPMRHATTLHVMLAFLLFAVGIVAICLYWFTAVSPNFHGRAYGPFIVFGALSIITAIVLVWLSVLQKDFLRKKRNSRTFRWIELTLMVSATCLFIWAGWRPPGLLFGIMSLVLVFALYNESRAVSAQSITIGEEGILLPTGMRIKKVEWGSVDQLLLRHHVLTISMADNTLIQRSISDKANIQSADLERWCNHHIEQARPHREAPAW